MDIVVLTPTEWLFLIQNNDRTVKYPLPGHWCSLQLWPSWFSTITLRQSSIATTNQLYEVATACVCVLLMDWTQPLHTEAFKQRADTSIYSMTISWEGVGWDGSAVFENSRRLEYTQFGARKIMSHSDPCCQNFRSEMKEKQQQIFVMVIRLRLSPGPETFPAPCYLTSTWFHTLGQQKDL